MKPDATCVDSTTPKPGIKPYNPCPYSYKQGQKWKCQFYEDLKYQYQHNNKTPLDLIDDGWTTKPFCWEFFCKCVKFILSNPEDTCSQCGECCQAFSRKEYATDPDKPCKPWENNPCTKLVGTEAPYICEVYDTDFTQCEDYPEGNTYGLFMELLNGNFHTKMEGGVLKITITPNCVFEFEREA